MWGKVESEGENSKMILRKLDIVTELSVAVTEEKMSLLFPLPTTFLFSGSRRLLAPSVLSGLGLNSTFPKFATLQL
jgi:hypothetical protein